ncbi:MAG: NAD-dependent deacylase [Ardenticatenaceae bacterium]|nr:NAD-dependent deacylase [Ardenticatenaceae bacterium]
MKTQFEIPGALVEKLHAAKHVVVLTGAGVSAESGVPTFREAQTGLWAQYDPQELATPQAFRRNPQLVWEWYAWRRELVSQAQPNPGHLALVELAKFVPQLTLITQNVDGLHQRAGSQNVVCLHGNIMETKCFDHDHPISHWPPTEAVPPTCPTCGSLLRPNVVWFGESLPMMALNTAVSAADSCDLFLAIGTSALVHPAASLPLRAVEHGATLVEINPQATPLTRWADFTLNGPAGVVLPALLKRLQA